MSATYSAKQLERFHQVLLTVGKEAAVLAEVRGRLVRSGPVTVDWIAALRTGPQRSDMVESFAAKFGRMQDATGDKLLPLFLQLVGEKAGTAIDYAAVIPKWTAALLVGDAVCINGDGETSRDFCYVTSAMQANLLAATTANPEAKNQIYNVAVGDRTTLNILFALLRDYLATYDVIPGTQPVYRDFRADDVRHSQADVGKATTLLGNSPPHTIGHGVNLAVSWYVKKYAGVPI